VVVTLTATVKAGGVSLTTGKVTFCDATATYSTDIHIVGSAQLTSAGTAIFKFIPGIGSHSYNAVFAGAGTFSTSSSNASPLTVTGNYPTSTTIAASGSAGNYTLTATVTVNEPAPLAGPVSFLDTTDANAVLATASSGSSATTGLTFLSSKTPATGSHPQSMVVGDFNGDGILDLATANYGSHTVTALLGNGNGTFTAKSTSAVFELQTINAEGNANGGGVVGESADSAGRGVANQPAGRTPEKRPAHSSAFFQ
jgi:hypothetical protein